MASFKGIKVYSIEFEVILSSKQNQVLFTGNKQTYSGCLCEGKEIEQKQKHLNSNFWLTNALDPHHKLGETQCFVLRHEIEVATI